MLAGVFATTQGMGNGLRHAAGQRLCALLICAAAAAGLRSLPVAEAGLCDAEVPGLGTCGAGGDTARGVNCCIQILSGIGSQVRRLACRACIPLHRGIRRQRWAAMCGIELQPLHSRHGRAVDVANLQRLGYTEGDQGVFSAISKG